MKNIKLIFFSFLMIMCNGKNEKKAEKQTNYIQIDLTSKNIKIPFCSDDLYFSKIKNTNFNFLKSKNNISLGLINISKYDVSLVAYNSKDDEHTEPVIILNSYFNKIKIDSLVVYETIKWEGQLLRRFCINKDSTIIIKEISKGHDVTDDGHDIIVNSNSIVKYYIRDDGKFENLNWKGTYFLGAIDKQNNKTSFSIKIQDLNNISVQIIYSPDEIENYKNIIAEVIEDNKIKIIFNPKLNDGENKMGEIFITNNGSDYFISGEPIYFINPGNDNLALKKLK
jgi:hypothetical protein